MEGEDGNNSLQVVESAQIDTDNPHRQVIASESQYANITFMVCGLKNYRGQSFDLKMYLDEDPGFIS